jgi:hypothetical protein
MVDDLMALLIDGTLCGWLAGVSQATTAESADLGIMD